MKDTSFQACDVEHALEHQPTKIARASKKYSASYLTTSIQGLLGRHGLEMASDNYMVTKGNRRSSQNDENGSTLQRL